MIASKSLKYLLDSIHDFMGLDLTQDQLLEFIGDDKGLLHDIEDMGYDTCNREATMSVIGKKLIGRKCPTYGDGQEAGDLFYKDLYDAARKKGLKVVGDKED